MAVNDIAVTDKHRIWLGGKNLDTLSFRNTKVLHHSVTKHHVYTKR